MKQLKFFGAMLLTLLFAASCSEDNGDESVKKTDVTITFNAPDSTTNVGYRNVSLKFDNVSTGDVTNFTVDTVATDMVFNVPEGLYNITAEGEIVCEFYGTSTIGKFRAYKEAANVTAAPTLAIDATFMPENLNAGFVISEIFLSGSQTPEGKQYSGDSYFRITNNSDETLYADGLVLVESQMQNDSKIALQDDFRNQFLLADVAWMIPGNGTDYPVAPGESLLLVDAAINHKEACPSSFDLSNADFEWYDESSNPNFTDVDNPDVPNLIRLATYSLTVWQPHMRGVKSYAVGYLGGEFGKLASDSWLTDYYFTYTWIFSFNGNSYEMDDEGYKILNEWIADGVNVAPKVGVEWLVMSPAIDAGFAYSSAAAFDDSRYGKAMRRKYDASTGKLVDTNNSTDDFDSMVPADPYYQFK